MFAGKYLEKNKNEPLIGKIPEKDLGIIVVIPCLREPEIIKTLDSLKACNRPVSKVEVIVVINHSEVADEETRLLNQQTKNEIDSWVENNPVDEMHFFSVGPVELKKKWAGAGLARKKGMDEALRRFNLLEKPKGLIVSLDADTLVEESYLVEIEHYFQNNQKKIGATIAFEHQKIDLGEKQLEGILLYEEYLKYYKLALDFTGYPYSLFTIGSAFAVSALAYVKRGGMNRRQAGEDFYFLQNLVQVGEVGEINTTKVKPSARLSDRVPFGTGPILQKWMKGEEDLSQTYNFSAFCDLKQLFDIKDQLFKINAEGYIKQLNDLPESIRSFVLDDNFQTELTDLNKNCSTLKSFQSRFFHKFNAFKILKFLNFAHERFYKKVDLKIQSERLNQEQQA